MFAKGKGEDWEMRTVLSERQVDEQTDVSRTVEDGTEPQQAVQQTLMLSVKCCNTFVIQVKGKTELFQS